MSVKIYNVTKVCAQDPSTQITYTQYLLKIRQHMKIHEDIFTKGTDLLISLQTRESTTGKIIFVLIVDTATSHILTLVKTLGKIGETTLQIKLAGDV